jgi:hypothetical protein
MARPCPTEIYVRRQQSLPSAAKTRAVKQPPPARSLRASASPTSLGESFLPQRPSATISHHRCGGRPCKILPPGTALLFDRPLFISFFGAPSSNGHLQHHQLHLPPCQCRPKAPCRPKQRRSGQIAEWAQWLDHHSHYFPAPCDIRPMCANPRKPGAPEADG